MRDDLGSLPNHLYVAGGAFSSYRHMNMRASCLVVYALQVLEVPSIVARAGHLVCAQPYEAGRRAGGLDHK